MSNHYKFDPSEEHIHATHPNGEPAGMHTKVFAHIIERSLPIVLDAEKGYLVPSWVMTLVHLQERRGHSATSIDWQHVWSRLSQEPKLRQRIVSLVDRYDAIGLKGFADEAMVRALRHLTFHHRYPDAKNLGLSEMHDIDADERDIVEDERIANEERLARQVQHEKNHDELLAEQLLHDEEIKMLARELQKKENRDTKHLLRRAFTLFRDILNHVGTKKGP